MLSYFRECFASLNVPVLLSNSHTFLYNSLDQSDLAVKTVRTEEPLIIIIRKRTIAVCLILLFLLFGILCRVFIPIPDYDVITDPCAAYNTSSVMCFTHNASLTTTVFNSIN